MIANHKLIDQVSESPVDNLSRSDRDEMFHLLSAHFDGVNAVQFIRDLDEKHWVLRVRRGDELVGFSTVQAYQTRWAERGINVINSGDTIMAPKAWNSTALARGWIGMVKRIIRSMPEGPVYWLLLSAGFRTYRFLPVFWRRFWPHHADEMPAEILALRDRLAKERYGRQFDPQTGVVRFKNPQRLKPVLAEVAEGRKCDPHVAFFLQSNPGWRQGDELVCLTELGDANLTKAGVRVVEGLPL
jgi:hypothetical protein